MTLLASLFTNVLAATPGKDCSSFLNTGQDVIAFTSIGNILSVFINFLIIISGIYALINLSLGGFQYLSSGGDKTQIEHSRQRIVYAILGLGIVASTVAIDRVLGAVFGVNIFGNIKFPGADVIVGSLGSC